MNRISVAVCMIVLTGSAFAAEAQNKMSKIQKSYSDKSMSNNADDMTKLSTDVDKVFKANGFDDKECKTVCTTTVTYQNGQAVPSVSCSLQCGF
jgi:hypothetical protein